MKSNTYDFRQFQEDLAALDRKNGVAAPQPAAQPAPKPAAPVKVSARDRLAQARAEFTTLRNRYGLSVADVVAFFPEEEGIVYLQALIAAQSAKPRRRTKKVTPAPL